MKRLSVRVLARPGVRPVLSFVLIPLALFGVPTAVGTPWLVGDNLIQNYPLRVLVGQDLRSGHLPLWNPLIWSGTPLLAGFNAGAAYPVTWLFALLPDAVAWMGNQVVVEVVAATGMLALLRCLGRSWTAASLAAGAFTYGGFMAGQSVHIDLVEAASWLPWAFVALDRLAHRPEGRSPGPWVALLGVSLGLMILAGSAEPILDGGLALAVFTLWLAVRTAGRRLVILLGAGAGSLLGGMLGAVQLLAGSTLQAHSQRAASTYWYFTSGSMNKSLTVLGLDPLLLGAGHSFPVTYLGTYNLPELSSYLGILPVMGLFGLLARRHLTGPDAPTWRIWYGIFALGLLLAWGAFTPFGHVLYQLPLFNRQRLLVRGLLVADLSLAVLFGVWVDRVLLARTAPEDAEPPARRLTSDVVLSLVPVLAVVGLQLALLIGGPWLPHVLHVPGPVDRTSLRPLIVVLTIPTAIALAAAAAVLGRRRLGRRIPAAAALVLVLDLACFNTFTEGFPSPSSADLASAAQANALAAAVTSLGPGPGGQFHRVALFDPDRIYPVQTDDLGQPDLNILRGLASIQGYGAIVDARYDLGTGTHEQSNLSPAGLADGTFSWLDLGVLVSVPQYFVHLVDTAPGSPANIANGATPLPPNPPRPSAPAGPDDASPTPLSDYQLAAPPPPALPLPGGTSRTFSFGTVLTLTSVAVPVVASGFSSLRIGLVGPDGTTVTWVDPPVTVDGTTTASVAVPATAASGIVLAVAGPGPAPGPPLLVGRAVLRTEGQGTYRLDGSLVDDLTLPTWHFAGMIGPFSVFENTAAAGRVWVENPAGSARIVSDTPWGDQTIRVESPSPTVLVRSVAYDPGWRATLGTSDLPVSRLDLLQQVQVPAGTHLVTFRYRSPHLSTGAAVTTLGAVLVVVLVVGPRLLGRRRRRRDGTAAAGEPAGR